MTKKMIQATLIKPEKLVLEQVEKPVPDEDDILIKVKRCGICGSDPTIYHGNHPYVEYPVVMGHEFSGIVIDKGKNASKPEINTRVTVIPHLVCGECSTCKNEMYNFCEKLKVMGADVNGAHAQYIKVPKEMVIPIPDSISFEEAALIEPACVGYHGAKRGNIKPSDKVLVIGAGPIGIFTLQSCKTIGAKEVYIADLDQKRLELAKNLGADGIINVSNEVLENGLERLVNSIKNIDVFYECVGGKGEVFDQILQLARRGTRIVIIGVLQDNYKVPHLPDFVQHELKLSGSTMYIPQDYRDIIELMSVGEIKTKGMITHHFSLEDINEVFEIIDDGQEDYFKIMLKINE